MGDATGLPDLLKAVAGQLEGERLPERSSAIRNTQLPPDQGAMPDVVYLLYSLGMLRNEKALPVLERVAEMLAQSSIEDFYSQSRETFTISMQFALLQNGWAAYAARIYY